MIKITANDEILVIDLLNFGVSINALTHHVSNSWMGTMTVNHAEHQGGCVIKDWIQKYEQGK